jgi:membrane protease subunit HflC
VQKVIRFIVTALIVLGIVAFMTTYTVRFTETAVVTTFGKADESSIVTEPGLRLKLPYPVQSVTKYDRRVRFVESRPETQNTADDRQIIVTAYLTYRVSNALDFYRLFSKAGTQTTKHYEEAEKILTSRLRAAMAQTSSLPMSALFASKPPDDPALMVSPEEKGLSGLQRLERRMAIMMNGDTALPGAATGDTKGTDSALKDYGIEVLSVGITSIKLPEETTKAVFARMKQTRTKLAQEALSRGEATANAIRTEAENAAKTILAFAERRAGAIRSLGDEEAAAFLKEQKTNPDLAVFIQNINFMREALGKKVTLVLPVSMPGISLMTPGAADQLRKGELPRFTFDAPAAAKPAAPGPTEAPSPTPGGGGSGKRAGAPESPEAQR